MSNHDWMERAREVVNDFDADDDPESIECNRATLATALRSAYERGLEDAALRVDAEQSWWEEVVANREAAFRRDW